MTEEGSAPAGWYDDGTGRQRWFDGTEWGAFADDAAGTPNPAPEPAVDDTPVVIRRTRRTPFAPPPEVALSTDAPVSRNWGLGLRSANAKKDSGMTRNRKIAGDLPDWSPMPPGELVVDRRGEQHP